MRGVQGRAGCIPHRSHRTHHKRGCPVITLQLQKLKRSLSFKTKSLRSKSADNFFPRTNSDVKPQADLLAKASPGPSPIPIPGSPASMPTKAGLHPGSNSKVHAFQEHVFKKPTFCDVCNHMIVGKTPPPLQVQCPGKLNESWMPRFRDPQSSSEFQGVSCKRVHVGSGLEGGDLCKAKGSRARWRESLLGIWSEPRQQLGILHQQPRACSTFSVCDPGMPA